MCQLPQETLIGWQIKLPEDTAELLVMLWTVFAVDRACNVDCSNPALNSLFPEL
jgi:hypothetical protein